MKILLTGGGTGGHFYPLIAVAESIRQIARDGKYLTPEFYYMGPTRYDERALYDNDITYIKTSAGKTRRYFSLLNFTDIFKTAWGVLGACIEIFSLYPDVVFAKGGYASFPALVAARLFRIPVVIHESDSKPGRVSAWAGKFARKIAVSYPTAAQYFDTKKVAYTGNPIRKEILTPITNGAHEFLKLDSSVPTILVLGGSQGSQFINETLLQALPELVSRYQIIHQTGQKLYHEVLTTSKIILEKSEFSARYKPMEYLNDITLQMSAGVVSLVVSRAGSSIFEIAAWGTPSIIIPLPTSISHDQTANAFAYARSGASVVIEQDNLTSHILTSEIDRIMNNKAELNRMRESTKNFARTDAARTIAQAVFEIALEHEK